MVVDTVCRLSGEGNKARSRKTVIASSEGEEEVPRDAGSRDVGSCNGAAIHIAARERLDGFIAEQVGERGAGKLPVGARGEAQRVGFEFGIDLRVGEVHFAVKARTRAGLALLEGVGLEGDLATIERATMQVSEPGEIVRDLNFSLRAPGEVVIAAGIGAAGRQGGFDIVIAGLEDAREAQRDAVGDGSANSAFEIGGAKIAVGSANVSIELVARFDAFELQRAGRRVAAEQRALRAAQDFDPLGVEDREAFENGVFVDDLVIDEGDGLRGVEVEVRVAEAADIGAREDAAEGGFDDQAGHAGREELDVFAGLAIGSERVLIERGERDGHVLDIFGALGGGHGNRLQFQRVIGRRSFLRECGGCKQSEGAAGRHGELPGTCRFHVGSPGQTGKALYAPGSQEYP